MCDGREVRLRSLHSPDLTRRDETARPGRARRATGQEQRVLLVLFRAAQPGGAHQQQHATEQDQKDWLAAHRLLHQKLVSAIYCRSMRRIGYRLIAAFIAIGLLTAAGEAPSTLRRGINITHWFRYPPDRNPSALHR